MKTNLFFMLLCMAAINTIHAQYHEINDNTFGSIGAGVLSPQGSYKDNFNAGFQINAEVNGRLYKPLWFYFEGAYENLPVTNHVITTAKPISTVGAGLGIKLFPVKFLYINGGAGIRGVVSGVIPNSDHTTIYYSFGAGVFPLKFLGIFASYTMWQAKTGYPSNNYVVAGVKFAIGRK